MDFDVTTFPLRDGRLCTIRPARPEDAEDMIRYMAETAGETPFLLRTPGEVHYTVEQERELLGSLLADPCSAMAAAFVDGKLAGNSCIRCLGPKRKTRHRCAFAIALYREYWGLGIGTALIERLTGLARQIGYEQIDLEVVADNERALALYRKCGFTETGRRVRALKFDDGSYHDELLMVRFLGES
ncbi:MAG: GNAT family N-acetyltransferase [Clostridia bacterium]|nr:GNAT family N-acetyltransferase [Clostridia bacterium]